MDGRPNRGNTSCVLNFPQLAQCGRGHHGGAEMANVPHTDQYAPGSCPESVVIRRLSLLLVPVNVTYI